MRQAMKAALSAFRSLSVEPGGAVPLAALLSGRLDVCRQDGGDRSGRRQCRSVRVHPGAERLTVLREAQLSLLNRDSNTYKRVCKSIDDFMRLDYTGVGLIDKLFSALQSRQPGPVCMGAAERLQKAAEQRSGPTLIATGFPEGGGVPETDGPVGAALLARAFFIGIAP